MKPQIINMLFLIILPSKMKSWDEASMSAAVAAVKNGMSVRKASINFSVPKSTLFDRISGKIEMESLWDRPSQLSAEDETELIEIAKSRAEKGIGFSKKSFLKFVGVFADEKGIPFMTGSPSDMWWRRVKGRHTDFSLRSPEATAVNRHSAMNKENITRYFSDLKEVYDKYGLDKYPSRVWNMDETGINFSPKPLKVLAKKGGKVVQGKSSISRETMTVIACGNAVGNIIPPHFIIPGKTTKQIHAIDTEICREPNSSLSGAKF